jgi:uncharacterized protein (TIGR03435 family)
MKSPAFRLLSGILGFALVTAAQTQPDPSRASFEAASIRPSPSGNGVRGGCRGIDSKYGLDDTAPPLGRCVITDGRLSHLIMIAWQLNAIDMIRNAPDWVIGGAERFSIQARADDAKTTEAQLLGMLRKLLEDRFQLKYHRENREESGFALVVAKNGPKMEKSRDDEVTTLGPFNKGNPTIAISARRYSMAMLASFLSTFGPGAVKDETGLQDFFDINLTWNEKEGPSVFTALQQVGLRLEPRKVPVSYFVIDSASRPGDN